MLSEYSRSMDQLENLEEKYLRVRRKYDKIEFELLTSFNFKAEYGKDNEKIRKQHMILTHPELCEQKDTLKLNIEWIKRRLKYLELCIEYGGE